jgi:ribosomal protein S18 acetylase RimI-like enzyme
MKYTTVVIPDDLKVVQAVAEAAFSDTPDSSLDEWFDFKEMARQIEIKRGMCIKAINEQDEVVGMIYGQQENPIHNSEGREKWVISIIGVHPKAKGMKVGSHLITAFESYAKDHGAIKLFVFTNKSDEEIKKFYQKNGYKDAGWIMDYQYGENNSAVFLLKYLK